MRWPRIASRVPCWTSSTRSRCPPPIRCGRSTTSSSPRTSRAPAPPTRSRRSSTTTCAAISPAVPFASPSIAVAATNAPRPLRFLGPHGEVPEVDLVDVVLHAPHACRHGRRLGAKDDGHHDPALDDEIVHADVEGGALDGIHLRLRLLVEPVVFLVAPAPHVEALPLVLLGRYVGRREDAHEERGIGRPHHVGDELEI